MVPDPHCASCNGTFVEKIEGEADDPRIFADSGPLLDGDTFGPAGIDNLFGSLAQLIDGGRASRTRSPPRLNPTVPLAAQADGGRSFTTTDLTGTRTFVFGGPSTLEGGGRTLRVTRRDSDDNTPSIAGPLMAQYLMTLLASRGMAGQADLFGPAGLNFMMGGGQGTENGRWGDYVFNQEALDEIISQIMENSNSSHPVPATEEVMEKLDRTVLEEGSPLLERDCAVCKEQFSLTTEDPEEQVVVTLPCHHPFHEGCIIPWLKSSATCPVCRHQLVPQPEHHSNGPRPPNAGPGSPHRRAGSGSSTANGSASGSGAGGGGVLSSFFNMVSGGSTGNSSGSGSSHPSSSHSSEQPRDPPGGWRD